MITVRQLLFILILALIGCTEIAPSEIKPTLESSNDLGLDEPNNEPVLLQTNDDCYEASTGGALLDNSSGFNCNQYLQAALIGLEVNLQSGKPNQGVNTSNWSNYGFQANLIKFSPDFIRVCNFTDAQAISHLPYNEDHVALITRHGNGSFNQYTYGITSRNGIYNSFSPNHNPGTTPCDYEYIAAIPNAGISGPYISNNEYRFTFNKGGHNFIINDNSRWSYNTAKFHFVRSSSSELVIKPKNCVSGNYSVSATINTNATAGNSCDLGLRGVTSATKFSKSRSKSFSVGQCGGTVNNNTLYTFNVVPRGTSNVLLNACNMTWVRTSGAASFVTSNNGQNMSFTLNGGSVTFQAYGSGCNNTYSFVAY